MNRLERLYAISDAIRRSGPMPLSAARLAEIYGVSRRTIERDIASLRSAGVPLYAERGRNGGHVSIDRAGKVVVSLSTTEVSALLVAVAAAGSDMPFADAASTATECLLDGLADNTRLGVEELRDRVRTQVNSGRVGKRIRRTVEEAVRRGVVVNLGYRNAEGAITERSADALGLFQGTNSWYLIAWCRLRDAGRLFRLDRITSARLTRQPNDQHDLDDALGWLPVEVTRP